MRGAFIAATYVTLLQTGAQAQSSATPVASPNPIASASPSPAATPGAQVSPSPSPTATATPLGLRFVTRGRLTFIHQNTAGEGQVGPEAAGFAAGAALAPNTPYDLLSSAPQVPGNSGLADLLTTATYAARTWQASLQGGLASVNGSVTNASYWGESLLPAVNPHLGSQALPYAITFPTHPGGDDANAFRLSILSGSLATGDGNLRLKAGWFDLTQTDRFVFVQPPLTSVNPAVAFAPAETLSSGLAGTDSWSPDATQLPLQGLDLVAKRGIAQIEFANAALPSLPGTSARFNLGSIVFDHGEGTRYSAEIVHVHTSGAAFGTTVPFGTGPSIQLTPQGDLPTSTLSGQQQTIAGLRAAFHLAPSWNLDGLVELGGAWYDASPVTRPGTSSPGAYIHAAATKTFGRATASVDFFRMEPRYATMILPYGIPENQWSTAFAWPGQWLKSNYQLIDNSALGVNRQGYRVRYYVDKGPLEFHFEYTNVRQLYAESYNNATQTGFVDGYYLPQPDNASTFGRQQRWGGWLAWHPAHVGDFTVDVVDDLLFRPWAPNRPQDQVSYEVPQYVATYARHVSPSTFVTATFGRYAMKGAFAQPIDFAQRLFGVGAQVAETPTLSALLSFRRSAFAGITTYPLSTRSPNFTGSLFVLEQRVQF